MTKVEDPESCTVGGPFTSYALKLRDRPDYGYSINDQPYPRGEICIRGPGVFKEYFRDPEKTAKMFDEHGSLLTGDIAELIPNGGLKIIDRISNIIKLANGDFVCPERL